MATDEHDAWAGDDNRVGEGWIADDESGVPDGGETSDDGETSDANETREDSEAGGHLEAIDDGCGCAEVWEVLSDKRE